MQFNREQLKHLRELIKAAVKETGELKNYMFQEAVARSLGEPSWNHVSAKLLEEEKVRDDIC